MKAPIFPVFTLKTKDNVVIIGGGGGNEDFGKKNGIVVIDETTYNDVAYLETKDIILGISIYDPSVPVPEIETDFLDWDEHSESNSVESSKKTTTKINLDHSIISESEELTRSKELDSLKNNLDVNDVNNTKTKINEDESVNSAAGESEKLSVKNSLVAKSKNDITTTCTKTSDNKDLKEKSSLGNESCVNTSSQKKQLFYMSCRGTNFFYIVKFENNNLILLKQTEKVVFSQYFNKSLFLTTNKELHCVYDVLNNLSKLDNLVKKPLKKKNKMNTVLNDESHEEYVYTIFRRDDRILIKREEGKTDILDNWEHFFIDKNKIHKVIYEDNKYTFVFNTKKYKFEREIGDIVCHNGMLVFYLRGSDSQIYFIEDLERVYDINKITSLNCEGDFVSVGTGDGYGYLFKGYVLLCKRKLCDFAITGISYRNGFFFYSSYNGLVDRKAAFSSVKFILVLVGIFIVLFAAFYKLYLSRK